VFKRSFLADERRQEAFDTTSSLALAWCVTGFSQRPDKSQGDKTVTYQTILFLVVLKSPLF